MLKNMLKQWKFPIKTQQHLNPLPPEYCIVTQIYILSAHWIGETQQGNIKKPNWSQHPVSSLPWSSDHKTPVVAANIPDISITGLHSPDAETWKKA